MASRLAAAATSAASSPSSGHGTKVNLWEDPMSPMRWKASHFMIATVTVWGGLVYAGFELFDPEERNKKTLAKAKALALAKAKAK